MKHFIFKLCICIINSFRYLSLMRVSPNPLFLNTFIETLFTIHSITDGSNQVLPYIFLIDYPECETLRAKFHLLLHVSRNAQCARMCIVVIQKKMKSKNDEIFFSAGVTNTLLFFKSFLTDTYHHPVHSWCIKSGSALHFSLIDYTRSHSSEHAHYACYSEIKAVVTMWTCDVILWLTDLI